MLETTITETAAVDKAQIERNGLDASGQIAESSVATSTGKKKSKKKPRSKKKSNLPTGFEEFYVDIPLTVEEHEIEKNLYDPRIETAIQRFAVRRRLHNDRRHIFDKYLTFGGIQTGPRMFQGGLDAAAIAENDAAQIATLTATHAIPNLAEKDDQAVVDFEGCLKGFLSTSIHNAFDLTEQTAITKYMSTIRGFLTYLLQHNVCPEYHDQVERARKVCDVGESELIKIAQLLPRLPGSLNKAFSRRFGGLYQYSDDSTHYDWLDECCASHSEDIPDPQLDDELVQRAAASLGTNDQISMVNEILHGSIQCVKSLTRSLEVVAIQYAQETQRIAQDTKDACCPAIGKLHTRAWHNPSGLDDDVSDEEDGNHDSFSSPPETFEFWIEDVLLHHMFVGMKLEIGIKSLRPARIHYFDAIYALNCSFYTYLPNEMMTGWKQVEEKWLPPREKQQEVEDSVDQLTSNADTEMRQ